MLRRLLAIVLALCFGLYTAEALIAEVHDGDATHAELVQADGDANHDAAHAAGHHDDGSHGSAAPDADSGHGQHSGEQGGHSEHACHHAHAHAGWVRAGDTLVVLAHGARDAAAAFRAQAPRTAAVEPQLRPPITA